MSVLHKVEWPLLKRLALTPARFDLLFCIYDQCLLGWAKRQSELRQTLGVSRATVSKMLKELQKIGFVRRERDQDSDTRQV